jgi:molecular chaperone GrpE
VTKPSSVEGDPAPSNGGVSDSQSAPPSGDASERVAAAEAKAESYREAQLRALADLENYRKRAEREIDQARKFAIERFAQELVAVGDALEAGIKAGSADPGRALLEGAQATLRELYRAFEKAGIAIIDPAGKPFDPNWHEAILAQPSADHPPNTVLDVVQKGFSLNGRLLRPARVIVSKAPDGETN